jgi:hypothetical protein
MIPFLLVLNGRHLRVWRRKRPPKHTHLHRDHAICCVALSGDARGHSVSHDAGSSLAEMLCLSGDTINQSKTASRYHISQRRDGCNTYSTHIQHHKALVSEDTRGPSKTVRHHCFGCSG